jgi:ABC-type multidrug transport system fused ATPase/permease subunit
LYRTKIIILDEATSNIDYRTDQFIQEIIRNKFKEETVITIAHRLNTLTDYDKIIVMDKGFISEIGSPQ